MDLAIQSRYNTNQSRAGKGAFKDMKAFSGPSYKTRVDDEVRAVSIVSLQARGICGQWQSLL